MSRKTWERCVRDDMRLLGLHSEWAIFKDMWRDLIWGKPLTLAYPGKRDVFKINDDDDDDEVVIHSIFKFSTSNLPHHTHQAHLTLALAASTTPPPEPSVSPK